MASPDLSYKLTFELRPEYLFVGVESDDMNEEMALDYLGKIGAKAREEGIDRLMVVRNVPVMLSDADLFTTTNFFMGLMSGKRVAFVNPHAAIADDMEFAIRIGTNRGAVYGLFDNEQSAEEWLLDLGEPLSELDTSVEPFSD